MLTSILLLRTFCNRNTPQRTAKSTNNRTSDNAQFNDSTNEQNVETKSTPVELFNDRTNFKHPLPNLTPVKSATLTLTI